MLWRLAPQGPTCSAIQPRQLLLHVPPPGHRVYGPHWVVLHRSLQDSGSWMPKGSVAKLPPSTANFLHGGYFGSRRLHLDGKPLAVTGNDQSALL
jgi:hypothetical protein